MTVILIPSCHSAEDFESYGQRGVVARIKQARRYLREADNALHQIEVVPVMVLRFANVADVICRLSLDGPGTTSFPMELLTSHRDPLPDT